MERCSDKGYEESSISQVIGQAVRRHLFERKPQHSIVIGRRPAAAVAVAGEKIDCAIRSLGYISQPAELAHEEALK